MAGRNDEDLGMFSNLYQSLTDRGPNKRRIKPLEGNLLQMTFGMASSDEDDSDFVAQEHKGDSEDEQSGEDTQSSQDVTSSQDASGPVSRSKANTGKMISLSDLSDFEEADAHSDNDADSEQESSSDEDDESPTASSKVGIASSAAAGKGILEHDFNSDSDTSFNPGQSSEDDADSDQDGERSVERRSVHRRSAAVKASSAITLGDMISAMTKQASTSDAGSQPLVCSVCLDTESKPSTGDASEDDNDGEMYQCDKCGVAVHEGCFGLGADSSSEESSDDGDKDGPSPRLEAWFCDVCRAGARPFCALCLSGGPGVYKPTADGRWVHTVCTLYTPGVVYGRMKYLSPVKLSRIARSRWNAKACDLCAGTETASLGVCIQCDAGLCRSKFHVTCAQKFGLLCEAPSNEVVADPFFALCHQHCDKSESKAKMLRFQIALKQCENFKPELEPATINASLDKAQKRFARVAPLRLYRQTETSSSSSSEGASKTNEDRGSQPVATAGPVQPVSPQLSRTYVQYQAVRDVEVVHLETTLLDTDKTCVNLLEEKEEWESRFEKVSEQVRGLRSENANLRGLGTSFIQTVATLHQSPLQVPAYIVEDVIGKKLEKQRLQDQQKQKQESARKAQEVAAAAEKAKADAARFTVRAAAKSSRSKPGRPRKRAKLLVKIETNDLKCCRCSLATDSNNIIDCDRCHLAYHIYCLDPPLKRKPQKTNICGWQCLDCDTSDSDFYWRPTTQKDQQQQQEDGSDDAAGASSVTKRGRRVLQPAKLCVSPTAPKPRGPGQQQQQQQRHRRRRSSVLSSDGSAVAPPPKKRKVRQPAAPKAVRVKKETDERTVCHVCKEPGSNSTLVRCDECKNCFHFPCLDPPRKSCPKSRGYSWRCSSCDSSDSDSSQGRQSAEDLVGNEDVLDKAEATADKMEQQQSKITRRRSSKASPGHSTVTSPRKKSTEPRDNAKVTSSPGHVHGSTSSVRLHPAAGSNGTSTARVDLSERVRQTSITLVTGDLANAVGSLVCGRLSPPGSCSKPNDVHVATQAPSTAPVPAPNGTA